MSSKMTVKKEAIMARFGGMGFHNSEANVWREMDDVQFNQYVGKVYRELSPKFVIYIRYRSSVSALSATLRVPTIIGNNTPTSGAPLPTVHSR